MTDLDDALDSSAPVWAPATLRATWAELPPGESGSGNLDSIRILDGQLGPGGYTVTHSLEDGLPDAVTMTTGSDASGKLDATLIGRGPAWADTVAWRTNTAGGTGSGTSFTATLPTDTTWGDYSIVAIAVNSAAEVTDANANPAVVYGWQFLGSQDDGSGLKVWVWGREYYTSGGGLSVALSASASYSWVAVSVSARTASGPVHVPIRPGTIASWNQVTNTTSHPSPSAVLDRRGYLLGIWARLGANGGWTVGAGDTELHEVGSVTNLMMATTALRDAGSGALSSATTSSATSTAVMMTLPVRIMDRPHMTARRYFSPLNADSPLYGFQRDTAPVELDFNVVTAAGVVATPIFRGQMEAVNLQGEDGKMPAVSRQRIRLNATVTLPTIQHRRESCSVDTLATWLMSRGGSFAGPGTSPNTIFWAPMYDTTHAFMDGDLSYGLGFRYLTGVGGPFGIQPPMAIPGPFVGGMFASSSVEQSDMIMVTGDRVRATEVPGQTGKFYDYLSQQNTKGRMTFWVRGDAAAENTYVAANDPGRNFLFGWVTSHQHPTSGNVGGISVHILNSTRQVEVRMGQQSGYGVLAFTGSEIPSDGEWHFVGVSWDWGSGLCRVQVDGWTNSGSGFGTTPSVLPTTDAALYAAGGHFFNQPYSRLPISDMQMETGPECWSGVAFTDFARFWPEATDINAVYRRTGTYLAAIADATPVTAWDKLAELARSFLISYRCDEEDQFNWLPLDYFGEDDQMTATYVADTEVNAGELAVVPDASKIRNLVTATFMDTRVDTSRQTVLSLSSVVTLPKGSTDMTFSLDVPAGEIHGAGAPYTGSVFNLTLLTGTQVDNPATIPADNYATVNTFEDGSGAYLTTATVTGRIVGYTSTSVTVRFVNKATSEVYLANDGQEVPFLRIMGYGVRAIEANTTVRDTTSIQRRGERPLIAEMPWIHTREVAEEMAGKLLNIITVSRPEITVLVVGDPRRKPGQLVMIDDSAETAAAGTWRVLSVTHNGDGPEYTQELKLVQVHSVLIWGATPGWGESVWG